MLPPEVVLHQKGVFRPPPIHWIITWLSQIKPSVQVRNMARTVEYLDGMLVKRKEGFRVILRCTSRNVQRNFTIQLDARNYLGTLEFDHKGHMLNIVVNPDSKAKAAALDIKRDIKSLSGGEKSYSRCSLSLLFCFLI